MQNAETTSDRLLTRSEVEEIFGVTRRFLEVAIARGEGPVFVRIGRAVRYRRADVVSWIETCAIDPREVKYGVVACRVKP